MIGIDIRPGPFTHRVGSVTDRLFVRRCMQGVATVLHTAALHKPQEGYHDRISSSDLTRWSESAASSFEVDVVHVVQTEVDEAGRMR